MIGAVDVQHTSHFRKRMQTCIPPAILIAVCATAASRDRGDRGIACLPAMWAKRENSCGGTVGSFRGNRPNEKEKNKGGKRHELPLEKII